MKKIIILALVALFAAVTNVSAQSSLTKKQQWEKLQGTTWRLVFADNIHNYSNKVKPKIKDEYSIFYFADKKKKNMFLSLGETDYGFGFYQYVDINDERWAIIIETEKHPEKVVFLVKMGTDYLMLEDNDGFTLMLKLVETKNINF